MVSESFAPHPYVIVAPPDHPLARRRRIPIGALLREPFVARERGSDTWNSMEQAFGRRLAKLDIAMEITSTETIKQAVIAGMGISFLSAHTISTEVRMKSLAVLDVQGFPLLLNWYVVHRRNKRLPPVALAFKRFLRDDGAALIEKITDVRAGADAAPGPRRGEWQAVPDPHGARRTAPFLARRRRLAGKRASAI